MTTTSLGHQTTEQWLALLKTLADQADDIARYYFNSQLKS